jgi:PKD repeat protein
MALALIVSAGAWGQYNPSNPAEPGAPVTYYTLTLQADPSGGGSFNLNATSNHTAGETFWVQANRATNFTFVEWTLDGEVVSTEYRFQYTMPAHAVTLIAHYTYTPGSPAEPNEPDIPAKPVYVPIWLTAQPSAGGSFNITSGTTYEVGTSVNLQANPASNFTFVNWTQDGEVISESRSFKYIVLAGADANRLVANFTYTPGSPGEPSEPTPKKIYHRVYLMADPAGGGYFNTESGNQFEEGTQQTFRAYNNQWYTFQNWTRDGEVVSTNSSYTLTIPTEDVELVAHYSYCYDPGSPGEPGQSTTKHLSVYGMTANGVRSQTVVYPVFFENTEDVYGVTVVVHFPEGFAVNTANVVQGERAAGHQLTVEALDGNAYRFDLTGTQLLTGQNGKIFDVPVTISADCEPDQSYQVVLTNAARINLDGSKEVINTRNGYIFVEDMKEDGLYAQFAYEKLQSRVQFNNLSADKAISYKWDFGDGTSSTEKSPMHIYAASGYYDVTLTVRGQSGSDVAKMTVLINDESTWVVDGVFFLDTEVKGVRYFTTAQDLFTFLSAKPIIGSLKVSVKAGETFSLNLTDENIAALTSICEQLANGNYTLTVLSGSPTEPASTLCFGTAGTAVNADVVQLFIALGRQMVCDDVLLKLWGISFNPTKLPAIETGQSVLSGSPTEAVDFAPVSTDLTFTWTATADMDTATGFPAEGTGNIPSMTATSGSASDAHIIYNIVATVPDGSPSGPATFCTLTHTITLKPALEGSFTDLTPADGSRLETTTVTLAWNSITNAVYDIYLWNAANQRPTTPVAEGISDLTYTSQNFCQNMKSYKWQVIARNSSQELASDIMNFSIHILPDLHITSVAGHSSERAGKSMEAGRKATIEWTVRNDGDGSTFDQTWQDRVWLVPDVYGGTNQTACKLLATVPNAKALASGQQYTNSVEVTLDEQSYGSYYLLVSSDMSTVTKIEWTSVGGTIVNPYEPVLGGSASEGTYAHIFATTAASGNQLEEHGETATRSDNFFYQKVEIDMPTMDEEDWLMLQQAYEQMGNGEGWTKPWDFNVENRTVQTLPGVSILEGHVTSIDLSNRNLTGAFPTSVLSLPQLRALNLSSNKLTGDISVLSGLPAESTLQSLNISNNQLSGNIGAFAALLPNLTTLYAEKNRFDKVTPMIAPAITTLTLGNQTLSTVLDIDLNYGAVMDMTKVPNILLYNHKQQNFGTSLALKATAEDGWQATVNVSNSAVSFAKESEQNAYYGKSGDVLKIAADNGNAKGTTLKLKLSFGQGDANFNGKTDVTDLQAQINFAFEDYNDRPFNFTSANLWTDEVINVQDVVKMTDLLLAIDDAAGSRSDVFLARGASNTAAQATLYIKDNRVWIDSEVPVSAFELTLATVNCELCTMNYPGFTCRSNSKEGITRIVGYSMSGATLPVMPTAIAAIQSSMVNGQWSIVNAVLSDAHAEEIAVRLIGGEATGISEIENGTFNNDNSAYDLQGRKVIIQSSMFNGQSKKGFYIVNGKKKLVK